jgi:NAD(P)-dependent dehydrogenase (short-subunit alcohol dehydrogenase family)
MTGLFDLTGKGAIVTGSSRGIGRAIAEAMAAQGANVIISSRTQDACEAVAEAINARDGGRASAVPASVGSKEDLQRLVATADGILGGVDILVCNAATNPYYGPMSGISDEQFEKTLRNNHHRGLDRGLPGLAGNRRLQPVQSSRFPAGQESGGRVRAAEHPRKLHRPWHDQNRLRPGPLGR